MWILPLGVLQTVNKVLDYQAHSFRMPEVYQPSKECLKDFLRLLLPVHTLTWGGSSSQINIHGTLQKRDCHVKYQYQTRYFFPLVLSRFWFNARVLTQPLWKLPFQGSLIFNEWKESSLFLKSTLCVCCILSLSLVKLFFLLVFPTAHLKKLKQRPRKCDPCCYNRDVYILISLSQLSLG